jgi:transcriptional regulator with XRE-family HTH domain
MRPVKEVFGERLKIERERKGLTQEKLGEKLNLSKQYISYYENGKRKPGIGLLINIAKELDVTTDYLLGNSDYRTVQEELLSNKEIFPQEAIDKILSLPSDVRDFLMNDLMRRDKFYDYVTMLFYCITFPYEKLQEWETVRVRGTDNAPETDYSRLRKKWLPIFISKRSEALMDEFLGINEE